MFCVSSLSFLIILNIVSLTFDSVLYYLFPLGSVFLIICCSFCWKPSSHVTWSFSVHLHLRVRHQKDDWKFSRYRQDWYTQGFYCRAVDTQLVFWGEYPNFSICSSLTWFTFFREGSSIACLGGKILDASILELGAGTGEVGRRLWESHCSFRRLWVNPLI